MIGWQRKEKTPEPLDVPSSDWDYERLEWEMGSNDA